MFQSDAAQDRTASIMFVVTPCIVLDIGRYTGAQPNLLSSLLHKWAEKEETGISVKPVRICLMALEIAVCILCQ